MAELPSPARGEGAENNDRARGGSRLMATRTIGSGQVGRSVPRLEGAAKVTGRADYVHNLRLPKMLIGKIFRSAVRTGASGRWM